MGQDAASGAAAHEGSEARRSLAVTQVTLTAAECDERGPATSLSVRKGGPFSGFLHPETWPVAWSVSLSTRRPV